MSGVFRHPAFFCTELEACAIRLDSKYNARLSDIRVLRTLR